MDERHAEAPFADLFEGVDPHLWLAQRGGDTYRAVPGRRTLRFEYAGTGWFVKLHAGVGWGEIVRNLLALRLPVVDAAREWRAARALARAGVPSIEVVAFGRRGRNPARRQSFLISREIRFQTTLDDLAHGRLSPPAGGARHDLILRVADLVRRMHAAGVHHRDLYLVHFLFDPASGGLRLIDLHRAGVGRHVPRRWRVKDLAALQFSAPATVSRRDRLRFLRAYFDAPLRQILRRERRLLAAVERHARRMQRRADRRGGRT